MNMTNEIFPAVRTLADAYMSKLKKQVSERITEMKDDDTSHRLIYRVLGVSDEEGVEESISDSYAMRKCMKLNFPVEQTPDATTLLRFRHLLEKLKRLFRSSLSLKRNRKEKLTLFS